MNCQAKLMQRNGILTAIITAIENFLNLNPARTFSSNEIYNNLPAHLQNSLTVIAGSYTAGACRVPASYAGTAASMLSQRNPNIIHEEHHRCPVLKRFDDAFRRN